MHLTVGRAEMSAGQGQQHTRFNSQNKTVNMFLNMVDVA